MNGIGSWINMQVMQSVARWIITGAGTMLVNHGLTTQDNAVTAEGAALVLFTFGAGIVSAILKHNALTVLGSGSVTAGKAAVKDAVAATKDAGL